MLGKMLIHGLFAAAIVGSAAAVYAQAKDNGYLAPAATPDLRKDAAADISNGYLRSTETNVYGRDDERRHDVRSGERHRERHDRKRDHDDDDD